MTAYWKTIYTFLVAVLVGTVGFFTYQYIESYKSPAESAINSIPSEVSFFIKIDQPEQALSKILNHTEIWNGMSRIPGLAEIDSVIKVLDSLITSDEAAQKLFEQSELIMAVCAVDSIRFGMLCVIALPQAQSDFIFEDFINKHAGKISYDKYQDIDLVNVSIGNAKADFFFVEYKGLLLMSYREELVKRAIDQLDSGVSIGTDESFNKIKSTAGKNSDAHLYIHSPSFSKFADNLLAQHIISPDQIAAFGEWLELDVMVKPRSLLLNGFAITNDSVSQYLDALSQEPQRIQAPEILPYDISMIFELGLNDFSNYLKKYTDYLHETGNLVKFDKEILSINKKYGIELQKQFFPLIGTEIGLAYYGSGNSLKNDCYFYFKAKDVKKMGAFLDRLAVKASRKNGQVLFKKEHHEYLIRKVSVPRFIPSVFGSMFSCLENNYYITIKDYVVMANNSKALIHLIDAFYLQKTLSENYNFQTLSDNISESSNLFLYCNTRKSLQKIASLLNPSLSNFIIENSDSLKSFEAFSLQFSYTNKMFYTNLYLKYNPEFTEVNPSNWEINTDANITGNPKLIRNFITGNLNILVVDELNNLYCIDPNGLIKWKVPIPETWQSDVFSVDYYKNGKAQFLFNTKNYICLYDINGTPVEGFPKKLLARATNGLSVFDYDNTEDYRLVLSLEDNRVYNYLLNGKLVEGWKKIKARSTVHQPVEHIIANKKDYMFVTDNEGRVIITNRRGESRIRLNKKLTRALNSDFYKNETNKKGIFITTNEKGQLTYISASGKLSYTDFGEFSPKHYFNYTDFDGDGSKDFIFVDKGKLTVFNKFKKVLFSYQFNTDILSNPVFFTINGDTHIGIVDSSSHEVFIFNKSGRAFSQQKIVGESAFATGSLNNNSTFNLIICSGNKVMNYTLE